jgi:PAS domain S-box-containing protein
MRINGRAVQLKGKNYLTAIWSDVTEQKRLREDQLLLSAAIEQSAESVVITDAKGNIVYVNPAFENVTGFSRAEAFGQNPRLLKSGKQEPAFYEKMWATLAKGEVWRGHLINKRKDGVLYEEDATITPVHDEAGKIAYFVAIKLDVTRAAVLERQLIEAQKMDAIGQLAGGVAHDYNNILGATVLQLGLLMGTPNLDPEVREGLVELKKSADRATSLTRQLLLFSRRQAPQRRKLEMNSLLDGTLKMLRRVLGEQVELSVRSHAGDAWVEADPGMMEQIVMNLCINGRDAMPHGGTLTVTVQLAEVNAAERTHPDAKSGKFVCLSVTDTGTGISPETLQKIFEPFFTTKEIGKGTGLGLATVHGIVKQHGGWVEVTSELGKGSEFCVYLPAITGGRLTGGEPAKPATLPRGRETVLVVEDEATLRRPLVRLLKFAGYKVFEAESAWEALELWRDRAETLDLLVTDMVMPGGVTGLELARALQAARPKLPVILMSGYSQELAVAEMQDRPGFIFLPKPCDAETLGAKVRQMLDRASGTLG